MKIQERDDPEFERFNRKILNALGPEGLVNLSTTLLGMADILGRHTILSNEGKLLEMPSSVKYALLQIHSILSLYSDIIHDKIGSERIELGFFPKDGWESESAFQKRLVLLVKLLHKDLKEKGLI